MLRERILYVIAVFDGSQFIYTRDVLEGALTMCEAGFRVTVALMTAHPEELQPLDELRSALGCHHPSGSLDIGLTSRSGCALAYRGAFCLHDQAPRLRPH